jgi:hypothetical protein
MRYHALQSAFLAARPSIATGHVLTWFEYRNTAKISLAILKRVGCIDPSNVGLHTQRIFQACEYLEESGYLADLSRALSSTRIR